MKWKIRPIPKIGDIMTKTEFAWFPTRIGNTRVWLEKYTAIYEYVKYRHWGNPMGGAGADMTEWRLITKKIGVHNEKYEAGC